MSPHRSAAEIRSGLKHPVIDGDGHWIEYRPVFAEKMRKAAGDKAADGFLASQRRIPDALSPDDRRAQARAASRWRAIGAGSRPTPATAPPR